MKHLYYLGLGVILFATSCNDGGEAATEEETVVKQAPIELSAVGGSPEFEGASIAIGDVKATPDGDNVKLVFSFDVKNYELMNQTSDADAKMCSNSDKGQHIHFILDNEPYAALYEPKHEVSVPKNSEHYLLVFLSRSYHESVKSKGASEVLHFKVDENGKYIKLDDPTTPMVFYSRPKGEYIGQANTDKLLFDFFLWNTEISDGGNSILAEIKANGVDTTMVINEWQSYFLRNVPTGNPEITLTLKDADGNPIDGPMTKVTRQFTTALEEPLPAQ
ncbi:MAG: hypothetical protein H6551_09510 [Chitinophagales bacterium]|nr:hypothetical protein [Chitinophagaceae bacterium]MCB9065360.1 hypothetical protein [Chitinophagales bacterium]